MGVRKRQLYRCWHTSFKRAGGSLWRRLKQTTARTMRVRTRIQNAVSWYASRNKSIFFPWHYELIVTSSLFVDRIRRLREEFPTISPKKLYNSSRQRIFQETATNGPGLKNVSCLILAELFRFAIGNVNSPLRALCMLGNRTSGAIYTYAGAYRPANVSGKRREESEGERGGFSRSSEFG